MQVHLKEIATGKLVNAFIAEASYGDLPLKKDGWNFNWRQLFKAEGAHFIRCSLESDEKSIEGLLMWSVLYGEMFYMNNVELAPRNLGSQKKYDFVAGCLISFACRLSFEFGKGHYEGHVSFDSKTVLIEHYQNKYGATWAMGQKMFLDPLAGRQLMARYLK